MKKFLKYLSVGILSTLIASAGFAIYKAGNPTEVVFKSIKATLNGTTTGTTYFEVTGGRVMDGSGNNFITGGALTGYLTGWALWNYMPISGVVSQIANINISGFYFGGWHDWIWNEPGVEQWYFFYDPSYPWIGMFANQMPIQMNYKSFNGYFSSLSVGEDINFTESSEWKNVSFWFNGFKYTDNYSADYTDRSLVDKWYVDSVIPSLTGITSDLSTWYVPYYDGTKLKNSVISMSGSEAIVSGNLTITGWNAITFTEGTEFKVNMGIEKWLVVQSAFNKANVGIWHLVLGSMYNTANLNTAIWARALWRLTNGQRNTAVGWLALWGVTTGTDNTAIGIYASQNTSVGNYNVSVGDESLFHNTGWNQNTALGMWAGEYSYGSKNVFLWHFADVAYTTIWGYTTGLNLTNAIAIGYNARVWTSNMMQLGNTGNWFISTNWNLGIGVSSPTNALSVSGNINVTDWYNIYDGSGNPYLTGVSGFLTGYTETDPIWMSQSGDYSTLSYLSNNYYDITGIDNKLSAFAGGLIYKGTRDMSTGAFPITMNTWDFYKIIVAWTGDGEYYAVEDMMVGNKKKTGTTNSGDWDRIVNTSNPEADPIWNSQKINYLTTGVINQLSNTYVPHWSGGQLINGSLSYNVWAGTYYTTQSFQAVWTMFMGNMQIAAAGRIYPQTAGLIRIGTRGTGATEAITFWNNLWGGTPIEAMRMDNIGRFGIGTSTPTQALDVSGNIQSFGSVYKSGSISFPATADTGDFYVGNSGGVLGFYAYTGWNRVLKWSFTTN